MKKRRILFELEWKKEDISASYIFMYVRFQTFRIVKLQFSLKSFYCYIRAVWALLCIK